MDFDSEAPHKMGLVSMRARFMWRATSSSAHSLDRANSQTWSSKAEIHLDNAVSSFLRSSSVWRLLTKSSRKSRPSHLTQSKKTNTLVTDM